MSKSTPKGSMVFLAFAFVGLFGLSTGSHAVAAPAPEPVPVRMVLQWEHQAQFAGYYMALEQGFYAAAGLDVEIIPGGAHIDPLEMVREGEAEFCTAMLSSVLAAPREAEPLVLMRQILNRSNLTLVAWKHGHDGKGSIETPQDLNATRISIWEAFSPAYMTFLRRYAVNADIVPQYYSLSLFQRRGVDACCAMRYNEYHLLHQSGIDAAELTLFDFHTLGIDLPEDGIYTRSFFYMDHPQMCDAFARASMQGWRYTRAHPEEALNLVMRYVERARLPLNRAHMEWMLETVLEAVFPDEGQEWEPGVLRRERFKNALNIMGLEAHAPEYHEFVTPGARHALDQ